MKQNQSGNKAYLFSIVLVAILGGLLFGYDTAVISGAEKGLQAFFIGAQDFTYTDGWHGFTCASALIGCIIGSAVSGYLATNWGRKGSLVFAGVMFFISALGSMEPEFLFFEHGVPGYSLLIAFNIYRVIGGVGVGLASAICPMYIAEVAPSGIRGTLVSWNQFAIIFGQLVVYMVNFLILGDHTNPVIESIGQGVNAVAPRQRPLDNINGLALHVRQRGNTRRSVRHTDMLRARDAALSRNGRMRRQGPRRVAENQRSGRGTEDSQ